MNDKFTNHFGYTKIAISLKRKSHLKKNGRPSAIIREAVSEVRKYNVSTAVDRLYGARKSLRGSDADRNKK